MNGIIGLIKKRPAGLLGVLALWAGYVSLIFLIAHLTVKDPSQKVAPYHPLFLHKVYSNINELSPLARWDSIWYLSIARDGYGHEGNKGFKNMAFPPLYPLVMRVFSKLFFLDVQTAGLAVSSLCLLITLLLLFYKLEPRAPPDQFETWMPLISLLAFPTAFILVSIYTESLFLLLCLLSYLLMRNKNYGWASGMAFCAALTRPQGLALVPLLGLMALSQIEDGRRDKRSLFPCWAAVLGFLSIFVYFQIVFGDYKLFFDSKMSIIERPVGVWATFVAPFIRISDKLSVINGFDYLIYVFEIFFVVGLSGAGFYLYRIRKFPESAFVVSFVLMSWAIGTFWGLARYSLALFPLFGLVRKLKNYPVLWLMGILGGGFLQIIFLVHYISFYDPAP